MTRFHECLALTLREESGEVQPVGGPYVRGRWSFMDHPKDPGGATMMGVTHRVYAAYLRSRGLPEKNVRDVSDQEIEDIYHGNYWQLVAGDSLPRGVDLAVFDFAVNSGPHRAICKLQSVLGVKVDGQLGFATLAAATEADPVDLIGRYMEARRAFCRQLSNFPYFARGWSARWDRIEVHARARAVDLSPPFAEMTQKIVDDVAGSKEPAPSAPRATEEAPASMVKSDTGNTAVAVGGTGLSGMGIAAANKAQQMHAAGKAIDPVALLLAVLSSPEFWMAAITVAGAAFIWIERRRKMEMDR